MTEMASNHGHHYLDVGLFTVDYGLPHHFRVHRMNHINLAGFTGAGYEKGRGLAWQAAWFAAQNLVFRTWWCPSSLRVRILRAFGASVGQGVKIRHGVTVHWPWKLSIGDNAWIGVNAWILNLEPVTIGSDCCVSQDVLLCTGSHSFDSPTFEFDNAPISIGDGTWVGARATVLRGVDVGEACLVGASALVVKDVPAGTRVLAPVGGSREMPPRQRAGGML